MWNEWLILLLGYVVSVAFIAVVILDRGEPTATVAWAMSILLVPYIGIVLYLVIARRRLKLIKRRRIRTRSLAQRLHEVAITPRTKPQYRAFLSLADRIGCRPATADNHVTLMVDSDVNFGALERAISDAKRHIHMLYFIWERDAIGKRFRDILIEKARSGVKVRVLTDGLGSFGVQDFMKPLIEAGGQHAQFLPVRVWRPRWRVDLRNHRKIAVVDGIIGFTGGINIGDEYTGKKKKVGFWRDTNIRLEGPAVAHLQEIFAEDWHFATGEEPNAQEQWFPPSNITDADVVQVVSSGPDTDTQSIHRLFFAAVNAAEKRIYLTTPYFIPDQPMRVALETAALRGVDVRILVPAHSDLTFVFHAGRSYYDDLLREGVRIFEYTRGVLHSKTMVVDDYWATVGSANMDIRSFELNFEVNAVIYGKEFASELAKVFMDDLKNSVEITRDDLLRKPLGARLIEAFARTLSPVL